nr:GTP cyclohydrolase 1 type 2 homolog [Nerophis lumbriciformis]
MEKLSAKLSEVVAYLDEELRIDEIPDYPGAVNGLQLENGGEVTKVAAAVDASLPVVEKAVAAGADLLVVHHGMFWQGARPYTGALYNKVKLAMDSGMAIYSAHLPLDVHPLLGNNAVLARELGLDVEGSFLPWKNLELGLWGNDGRSLGEFRDDLARVVGGAVLMCGKEDQAVGKVGIVTGGAGSEIEAVAKAGVKTFITGEGPHWSHPLAEELGVQFLYGGHYATETFGVRAMARHLAGIFKLEEEFVDHPTNL